MWQLYARLNAMTLLLEDLNLCCLTCQRWYIACHIDNDHANCDACIAYDAELEAMISEDMYWQEDV